MNGLKIIQVVFTLIFLLLFSFLKLGMGEEKVLTLSEAVNLALSKNPTLKAADHLVEAAKAKEGGARSGLLPQIDFYERYNRTNNPMLAVGNKLNQEVFSSRDYDLKRLNNPSPVSNFNTQVVLTQPIFDQGKTLVAMRQAKFGKEIVQEEKQRVRQEVIFGVIDAYSQAMKTKEDLKLAQETEKVACAHVQLAEDLFHTGHAVKSDLLSAQVRVSELKEIVIEAKNSLKIAQAALNQVMGVDQDEVFELAGGLEFSQEKCDLKKTIDEALQKRPDLLAMENKVKNAQEEVRMAKANYLPAFNFMAQYDLNDKNDVWNATGESWTIGGVFHFNVFDGLNSTYKLKEAHEVLKQLESQKEELMSRIELEVRGAFHQLEEASERVKVVSEAITQAEESLRIVEDRYKVGLSNIVEVLDNEVALTKAKRNLLYALYDCRVAQARLDLTRGVIIPPQE